MAAVKITDLPEMIRIGLKLEHKKELLINAISKAGSQYKLAEILSSLGHQTIKRGRIDTWYRILNSTISLKDLKVLSFFLKIPLDEILENTSFIKGCGGKALKLFNPKFPFKLNSKMMNIMGHIFGDGGVHGIYFSPWYCNKNEKLIQTFVNNLNTFGIPQLNTYTNDDGVKYVFCPQIIGFILLNLGINSGDKRINEWEISKHFFTLDKRLIGSFLRGLFDDDGSVSIKKHQITLYSSDKNFLEQIRSLLRLMKITSSKPAISSIKKYKDKETVVYLIRITHKKNFKIFWNFINFDSKVKQKRLKTLLRR